MEGIKKQILQEIKRYKKLQKKLILLEGLIYSYSIGVIKRGLKKIGVSESDVVIEKTDSGGDVVIIKLHNKEGKGDKFEKISNFLKHPCGWEFAVALSENGKPIDKEKDFLKSNEEEYFWLQYEPKFDVEIDSSQFPPILYHITPEKNVDSILKKGLVPSSKNKIFSYPHRNYVGKNLEKIIGVVADKEDKSMKDGQLKAFVIFRIKMRPDLIPPIKMFKDPNLGDGYYVYENIPSRLLTPYRKVYIDKEGKVIKIENYAKQPK